MRKLSHIEQKILELANIQPIGNYKQFAEYSKIPYQTIKQYIPKLIKNNYLITTNDGIIFNKDSDYKPLFNKNSDYKPLFNCSNNPLEERYKRLEEDYQQLYKVYKELENKYSFIITLIQNQFNNSILNQVLNDVLNKYKQ